MWATINSSDINNPIAQVFVGEQIDLNHFLASVGLDKLQRARNIASDPYAAAKFHHFIINTIFETLFGISVTKFQVKSSMGVLGELAVYFGLDEVQNRGSIHLHVLLWHCHAPSPNEILKLLQSEAFHVKVIAYIDANFRAYLPGFDNKESVKAIPKDLEVSFNRPPVPHSTNYKRQLDDLELHVARVEQVHECKKGRCLVAQWDGSVVCKRKVLFEITKETYVNEDGRCGPKRLYGQMNSWIPHLTVNVLCNNDSKFLTNGCDASNITHYVTSYATKKQGKSPNASAVMARGYAYHLAHPNHTYAEHIHDQQRLLLFRLVNSMNLEQEIAGPLVMLYLMGWGDQHKSHTYTPVYWSSFTTALLKTFPALRQLERHPETHQQGPLIE